MARRQERCVHRSQGWEKKSEIGRRPVDVAPAICRRGAAIKSEKRVVGARRPSPPRNKTENVRGGLHMQTKTQSGTGTRAMARAIFFVTDAVHASEPTRRRGFAAKL